MSRYISTHVEQASDPDNSSAILVDIVQESPRMTIEYFGQVA